MENLFSYAMACETNRLLELAKGLCSELKKAKLEDPLGLKPWGAVCSGELLDSGVRAKVLTMLCVREEEFDENTGMTFVCPSVQKTSSAASLQTSFEEAILIGAAVILQPYVNTLVENSLLANFNSRMTISRSVFKWNFSILRRALEKLGIGVTSVVSDGADEIVVGVEISYPYSQPNR